MGALVLSFCLLAIVGVLLQLAWRFLLASLVWAPSAYAALIAGWFATQHEAPALIVFVVTIVAAALVRACLLRLFFLIAPPRRVLVLEAW